VANIKDIINKHARSEDDALFLARLDDKLSKPEGGSL
jgi:hypothetical protein